MRTILVGLIVLLMCSVAEAHWIRVGDQNQSDPTRIIDSSSNRVNLSDGKVGTIVEVPKDPFPRWGDHYVNGVVVQDSPKRQEEIDDRNARKTRAIAIKNKLVQKGFTNEEAIDFIRAIFGN